MFASLRPIPREVLEALDTGPHPLVRLFGRIRGWRVRREAAVHLDRLTDHHLADIGITRDEIEPFVAGRLHRL
jgi:uncharacterized protein YjiS (DUF1127 family)